MRGVAVTGLLVAITLLAPPAGLIVSAALLAWIRWTWKAGTEGPAPLKEAGDQSAA